MTISKFTIEYDALNDRNIFTNGDSITGRVIVVTKGQTKVRSLTFTAEGEASVMWPAPTGENSTVVCRDYEEYYHVEHSMLAEPQEIGPGRHVFPFTFQIPDRSLPSTFKSNRSASARVVYSLEAKLSRSMRIPSKAKTHFTFVSKADMTLPGLMEPQYGSKVTKVAFFASGSVSMNVFTEKMGYLQGEDLNVTVEVVNSSTRSVTPKYKLYKTKSFFCQVEDFFMGEQSFERHGEPKTILKDKDTAVEKSGRRTVIKTIRLSPELPPSILNCRIVKLEYRLKVKLDIALTKNPEIELPIVILPNVDCWSSSKALETHPSRQIQSSAAEHQESTGVIFLF